MVKRAIFLALLVSLGFARPVLEAEATGNGKISGVLVNKTDGGGNIADKVVSLELFQDDKTVGVKTTRSDNAGRFIFESLPTDSSYTYEIAVTYQNVEYRSDRIGFSAGKDTLSLEIDVFETTTDAKSIFVMLSHATVYFENNSLLVKEYFLFVNSSNQTYIGPEPAVVGGQRETLKFTLPDGATDVQSSFGLSNTTAFLNGSSLINSEPLTPTGRDVSYSYRLPCNTPEYTISWKVNYAMKRFDLLVPEGNITVAGDKLTPEQPLSISGRNYKHYSSKAVVPGDVIVAKLSGLTGAVNNAPATGISGGFNWAWLALIPLAVGAGLIFIRKRNPRAVAAVTPDSNTTKDKLLAEIAELDDGFEEGQIAEEEYSRLRTQKKRQLMKLVQ